MQIITIDMRRPEPGWHLEWIAHYADDDTACGHGRTEKAAIADLKQRYPRR